MAVIHFALLVCLVFVAPGCHGYGWGVPENACSHMFPSGHGTNAAAQSTVPLPVTITLNASSYQPNDVIEVTMSATTATKQPDGRAWFIEGVFFQVRTFDCDDQTAKGTFSVQDGEDFLQPVECFDTPNSAIRHFSHAHIYNRKFYWHAPATAVGHVALRGTIARNKGLFWVNVFSDIITDASSQVDKMTVVPCLERTEYDKYEFCPDGQPTDAAAALTTAPLAFLMATAAALFL